MKLNDRINPHNIGIIRRLTTIIMVASLACPCIQASQPKLVVGIVVDGLRQETLDLLQPFLSKDGFNRFLDEGVVYDNVEYGTNLDATAATAMLMTGASPRVSGVSADEIYDPSTHLKKGIFTDNNFHGANTAESVSPSALKVTTLSDEARIAGAGVTYVYAIAPDASRALILGSHAGNSAIWFNPRNGNWASTNFYRELPAPVVNANRTRRLATRIDTMQWTPSDITTVAAPLPEHITRYPFRYTFAGRESDKFERFEQSPLLNREITYLAEEYIRNLELGRHDGTDILNIAYSIQPYKWSKTPENRYELYDSYVKLDESLARLFSTIDSAVGRENAVVFLAATPAPPQRRKDEEKWNIPGGDFSSRKAVSLLNLYLIAMHGNGEWVTAFNDGHFYLNKDLANNLNKDITLLRRQAAEFLVRMAGVGHAYTIDDILTAQPIVPNATGQSRNIVLDHSGDVIIDLIPGWSLLDDFNNINEPSSSTFAIAPTTASFMIWTSSSGNRRIDTPVDARAIAPALSNMLHIRSPNGAGTPPIAIPYNVK